VWVQFERGLLHAALFASAVMSSIILSSNWYVLVLGVLLILVAVSSAAYRIVVYPFDPTSVSGQVYRWFFQGINLLAPWYALSTWGAVFNLGAMHRPAGQEPPQHLGHSGQQSRRPATTG
jgi:hypothetical protein